ncbi:MAG: uroporphyrinogen decarboxylase family protein [Candidatus Latescibacteria bacterium]|jgi:uroporphyrinogen decarboxylase|nr:uroporphyrinogen decarboxylase family protein [Candidatus Latescibacterota bacterium]
MTPRERFIAALERRPLEGRVPHFELVFFLTMEAFGRVHPSHRRYHQWDQMEDSERELHRRDVAGLLIGTARRYDHSAIFLHANPSGEEEAKRIADIVREQSGEEYFLMLHGDATYSIPNGSHMEAWCARLVEAPQEVKDEADRRVDEALERGARLAAHGAIDGFALCADYCFNTGPFLPPDWFDDFVTPYLTRLIQGYRSQGHYIIKHTDGNIMPILGRLVDAGPHALHSLDPQGGVDIAEVKRRVGDRVCLIGNVNCGLLDSGTDEKCIESARYALRSGMPGGGYVFSTSNCVYTGMRLSRYELILDVWRREGNYPTQD